MKSKLTFILVLFLVLLLSMPLVINADTGPKPSVVISFEGLENEKYYVTLLSESPTTGPHRVYDGESNPKQFFYGEDEEKEYGRNGIIWRWRRILFSAVLWWMYKNIGV